MNYFQKCIYEYAKIVRPDIIHAHSPYFSGLPSYNVAKKLCIPFVYELRGLVEDSWVANGVVAAHSIYYDIMRFLETRILKNSQTVVVISQCLKDELISRKIPENKINIVPNGVNPSLFAPNYKSMLYINKYKLTNKFVIAYIGSLRKLEGLEFLFKAFKEIKNMHNDIKLVIVGEGPEKSNLVNLSKCLGK